MRQEKQSEVWRGGDPQWKDPAFSLIEVTLALGILAFAILPLFGLLTIGLNSSHENSNRALKAQILGWVQGESASRTLAYQAYFDESGIPTDDAGGRFKAAVTPKRIAFPGSPQSLAAWEVVIYNQTAGGRVMDQAIVWGSE